MTVRKSRPYVRTLRTAALGGLVLVSGCAGLSGADRVAVDPVVVKVPVPVPCKITLPPLPTPYVEQVQWTGSKEADALAVFRAMEAELEERIAYEAKLRAAAMACVEAA